MKKVMLNVFKIIIVMIILIQYLFINYSLGVSFKDDSKTLEGYLLNNKNHIWESGTTLDGTRNEENLRQKGFHEDGSVAGNGWLRGFNDMISWINNDASYDQIAEENEEYIQMAIYTIFTVEGKLDGFMDDLNDNVDPLKDITGYSKTETAKYMEMIKNGPLKELYAAKDYNSGKGSINDSYIAKFMYPKKKIRQYLLRYGNRYNLTESQIDIIKKVWRIKQAASDSSSIATRTDLYVDKNDSFETMMSYDEDQIRLFYSLWGKIPTALPSNGAKDGVMIEWDYVLSHNGQHSPYYNSHVVGTSTGTMFVNDGSYYDPDSRIEFLERRRNGEDALSNLNALEEADELTIESLGVSSELYEQDEERTANMGKYTHPDRDSSYAKAGTTNMDDTMTKADEFVAEGDSEQIDTSELQNFSNMLYNILLVVGIIVAVIVGGIIGIKFMLGSAGEKADVKQLLVPYVVGCVVVFGAFGIWKLVVTILSST